MMSTTTRPKKKDMMDILESLSKNLKKKNISEKERIRRVRMYDTREWSMRWGNGKIPKWTEVNWSPSRQPIIFARTWYQLYSVPTRVRTKTLKTGKKRFYLDIYNHTARKFISKKKR